MTRAGWPARRATSWSPRSPSRSSWRYDGFGGGGKPRVGQIAVAYDTDRDRAHDQFRWFGLGWRVNTDLPGPPSFEGATQFVTPEQVGQRLPCGDDIDEYVQKVKPFVDAGFTEVALVQIGADHQQPYFEWAEKELLPALCAL